MKSSTYTIARFITALFTILAIAGQSHIPKKRLLLHPTEDTNIAIDGYIDPAYGTSAKWINKSHYEWSCMIPSAGTVNFQGCGATLTWGVAFKDTFGQKERAIVICKNALSDQDGDGWGWENEQSCTASTGTDAMENTKNPPPYCSDSSSDPDGDGWGWENQTTCKIIVVTKHIHDRVKIPCMNLRSDVNGDGLGLEYGKICKVRTKETPIPPCSNASSEKFNNGWGWEDGDFCLDVNIPTAIEEDNKKTKPLANSETTQAEDSTQAPLQLIGIDFSAYDALKLKIYYEGRASHLRVYLRNANPEYTTIENHNTAKFMSVSVLAEDLTTGFLEVKLSDFGVAEWWSLGNLVPRQLSGPEFDNIISLGVDHITPGLHKVRLEQIELTGEWLSMEDLLISITLFWLFYLVLETLIRYYSLRRHSQITNKEIDSLTKHAQLLQAETHELQELSVTDPLTGIFNRSGLAQFADALFKTTKENHNLGMMILDIDHFKQVNDTFGHDIGDNILKAVTNMISSNIRGNDIFGRWGGEEFVLICPKTSTSHLMSLAEKLRRVVDQHNFEPQLELDITISIGATIIRKGDTFNAAFKRADIALYTAKNQRNKVSLQP